MCAAAAIVAVLLAATSASAATFTVNSIAEDDDLNFGGVFDGVCDADPTADVDCTLRAAIQEANATAAADAIGFQKTSDVGGDPDDVAFVNGKAVSAVSVAGVIPTIVAGLSISAGNCAADFFDRAPCALVGTGWVINSSGAVNISGLAFKGTGTAIDVNIPTAPPAPQFTLRNSWFGIDTLGGKVQPPTTDVLLRDVDGAQIGGDPTIGPNIFARHDGPAVDILGADDTVITNNMFGVLPDGSFPRAGEAATSNGSNIEVTGNSTGPDPATGTVIGGSDPFQAATPACEGLCNLISNAGTADTFANDEAGVDLLAESGQGETSVAGVTIVGNQLRDNVTGIEVGNATGVHIGGPAAGNADRNLIDAGRTAIHSAPSASGLLIQNNVVSNTGTLNAIKPLVLSGSGQVLNNIVSGKAGAVAGAVRLETTSAPNFVVQGNVIGEDAAGNPVATSTIGIELLAGANGNTLGGSGAGEGNTIGGLFLAGSPLATRGISIASDNNSVAGNRIGIGSGGTPSLLFDGIELITDADGNTIGGNTAASENLISNVRQDAIVVTGTDSDGNQILRNRGAANGTAAGDLFIDLGDDGVGNLADPNGPNTGAQAPAIAIASATTASGTAAPGATVRLFTKANATAGELEGFLTETTASGAGTWTATFPAQADGKLLAATSTVTGNTSELSSAVAVDAAAPQTQIDSGPADGGATGDSTPTFGFSASEAGTSFECRIDGASFAACSGPGATHTSDALADGPHTFEVRATDAAANTDATPASSTFTVDTGPPETQIDSGPAAGATTGDATPTLGFSASEPGSTFECRIDLAAFAPCSGPGATHTPATLADGPHTFEVRAIDAAGNMDASPATRAFSVDTSAPDTRIDSGPAAGSATRDSTPTFGFSAIAGGVTFECRIDSAAFAPCSGPGATHTPTALQNGTHTFQVRASDVAGNADATPASRTFTVDRDPPETTITKRPAKRTSRRVAKFKFRSDERGATFRCKLDRGRFKRCSSPFRKRVKPGRHTFRVRATDRTGNTDATPAKFKWRVRR